MVKLELVCPNEHRTEVKEGEKLECSQCRWKPILKWDGQYHYLAVRP